MPEGKGNMLAIQVWFPAGTTSIHLDVYPSALSLLQQRYCAILKPSLFIFIYLTSPLLLWPLAPVCIQGNIWRTN
jgi:hypothetical protein